MLTKLGRLLSKPLVDAPVRTLAGMTFGSRMQFSGTQGHAQTSKHNTRSKLATMLASLLPPAASSRNQTGYFYAACLLTANNHLIM